MYEIATLKTKKLPELQEIAKKIGIKRITGLKKLDLIYQIVDYIASRPDEESKSEKPKETSPTEEKKLAIKVLPVQKSKNDSTYPILVFAYCVCGRSYCF